MSIWNKFMNKRVLSFLLGMLIFCSAVMNVRAENLPGDASGADVYKIYCISSYEDKPFEVSFIEDSDMLMIAQGDAEKIIGEKLVRENGFLNCEDGCARLEMDLRGTREKDGELYVWFPMVMEYFNVKVSMVGGVLDTQRLPSYEMIRDGINETFTTKQYDPFDEALEDGWTKLAMKTSEIFDVIYNLKIVDAVTTKASRDKYDDAMVDVLVPNEAVNPTALIKEGDSLAGKLKKLSDFEKTGWTAQDWLDAYEDFPEYMQYCDALKKYSDISSKLHVSEACELIEFIYTYGAHDENILNGMKLLRSTQMQKDSFMKIASDKYINYYSDNGWSRATGIAEKIMDEIEGSVLDQISKKGLKAIGIDSTIVSIERMLLNGIFDTQTKFDTVKKLDVYHELQGYAKSYWKSKQYRNSEEDLKNKRDVALLFLQSQLCSIKAMKKAEPSLAGSFSRNETAIQNQISKLSTYTDEAIDFEGNYPDGNAEAFEAELKDYVENNATILDELTIDKSSEYGTIVLTWDYDLLGQSPIFDMTMNGHYGTEAVTIQMQHVAGANDQIRIVNCDPFWRTDIVFDSGIFDENSEPMLMLLDHSKDGKGSLEISYSNGFVPDSLVIDVMDALVDWDVSICNNCNFYISGSNSMGKKLDVPPTPELFTKYPTGMWEYSVDLKFE